MSNLPTAQAKEPEMTATPPRIDAVAIGRNEGDRLLRCLDSLVASGLRHVVYVDSGSTDDSIARAEARGVTVVRLDMDRPFTAARARNAGIAALPDDGDFVQFVDGDCSLDPDWIGKAATFLRDNPVVAAVCGRRREIAPEASVYNRLIDREWDTPAGRTRSCGGDVLMRRDAFAQVGGFDDRMIAGEEPELCVRLRQAGWQIWRLDAEMTRHDADIHRFAQWWRRSRRAGHAYAEGAAMHGAPPERHNVAAMRRALTWGALLPVAGILGGVLHPALLLILLAWPAQVLRLALRDDDPARALFLTLGKIPEAIGILEYHLKRVTGRKGGLIEYK